MHSFPLSFSCIYGIMLKQESIVSTFDSMCAKAHVAEV